MLNEREQTYDYDYPNGLDLSPDSELHGRLVQEVVRRAREARQALSPRRDAWKEIDRTLTAYIKLDTEEKKIKEDDKRKPVSIVVPVSYAALETLLTYFVVAFLQEPIFRYDPVAPEDVVKVALLEKVVAAQMRKAKAGLALHTMWRDSLAYGFGVATPVWTRKYEMRTVEPPVLLRPFAKASRQRVVSMEYNDVQAIDPYSYLPDPSVPVYEVQRGEFVGWVVRTNRLALLEEERDGNLFNVRYLKGERLKSQFYGQSETGRYDKTGMNADVSPFGQKVDNDVVDVVYMYINLVPSEWNLGPEEYPQKWLFAVAGDKYLIDARPIDLDHDMFPVAVASPDFDGHSLAPTSRLEVVYGLQQVVDWMFNSHVANVRKAINDMLIVDPSLVNMNDLLTPQPGKIVRLRRAAWGRGVDAAVKQLGVTDVTARHIQDTVFVFDVIQRVTAAVDSLQGILRRTSERRSATEARDVHVSALSRLERAAKVVSMQAMYDLAYMIASQTRQFMSREMYVSIIGRWQETLMAEYGRQYVGVKPDDVDVNFDVVVHDGTSPLSQDANAWVQLFQILMSQPELHQVFDIVRVFKHVARLMGAKNVDDFVKETNVQTMLDEEVLNQAEHGQLVPFDEYEAAYARV